MPQLDGYGLVIVGWGALVVVTLLIGTVAWMLSRRTPARDDGGGSLWAGGSAFRDCAALQRVAEELAGEAAVTAQAAHRAADEARRAGDRAAQTDRDRDAAWHAYDTAERAYSDARRATETPRSPPTPDDGAVSKAALAAYRRGDLSVEALGAVLRRTSGWAPEREQQARATDGLRAQVREARLAYDAAAAADRTARTAADIADVAAHALAQEAGRAADDAEAAHEVAEECIRRANAP